MGYAKHRYRRKITAFIFEDIVRCNTAGEQHQFTLAVSKLVAKRLLGDAQSRQLILGVRRRDQPISEEQQRQEEKGL